MNKQGKTQKGITLIALIITIIVMLILVGVTISMSVNGGLFEYAGNAVKDTNDVIHEEQQLANGGIQVGGLWYDSIDDLIPKPTDDLQEQYEFSYYSTLSDALTDANNGIIENNDADNNTAVAAVYTKNGNTHVVLLKDIEVSSTINITKNITFNLGGNTLTFTASGACLNVNTADSVTIDGRLNGSAIINKVNNGGAELLVASNGTSLTVNGGTYIMDGSYAGVCMPFRGMTASTDIKLYNCTVTAKNTGAGDVCCVWLTGTGSFVRNCTLTASTNPGNGEGYCVFMAGTGSVVENSTLTASTNTAAAFSIYANQGVTGTVKKCSLNATTVAGNAYGTQCSQSAQIVFEDCSVNTDAPNGISYGIYGLQNSTVTLTDCDVFSDTDLMSEGNSAGRAVASEGKVIINDGYYYGAREALISANDGTVDINGGVFEGLQHGGAYFGGKTAKVKNATLRNCDYKGKYDLDEKYHYGSMYIGSNKNECTVYMDNCVVEGGQYGTVLSSNYSYMNTYLYVSNTTFTGSSYDIRVDGVNDLENCGHLYVGENVTYNTSDIGTGAVVDLETYSDSAFLQ